MADILRARKARGRCAFIPYITAGDPSLEWTDRFARALAGAGADVIELGVPFSDPVADGAVNQRAAERALAAGTTLPKILRRVAGLRRRGFATPIVLFTYYNPVLRMGLRAFARAAAEAGVQGVLAVDLPPEEASDYRASLGRAGVETVFLAAPTTSAARLRLIDEAATGFVYYVSRLGVTGERRSLSRALRGDIKRLRRFVKNPIAVGFGISTPEQARAAGAFADAVVVGSALVRCVQERPPRQAARSMKELAAAMVRSLGLGRGRADSLKRPFWR